MDTRILRLEAFEFSCHAADIECHLDPEDPVAACFSLQCLLSADKSFYTYSTIGLS